MAAYGKNGQGLRTPDEPRLPPRHTDISSDMSARPVDIAAVLGHKHGDHRRPFVDCVEDPIGTPAGCPAALEFSTKRPADPPPVVQVLAAHLNDRGSDEPLWPNIDGGRQWYSTAFRLLRAAYLHAGITGASGFHTLRRTAGTLAPPVASQTRSWPLLYPDKTRTRTRFRWTTQPNPRAN